MDIGTKIKNAREDKDMLQKQMADLIPMNQSNYSKIERNFQEPSMYQLKRIAEILDIDLNELLEISNTHDKYHTADNSAEIDFAKDVKYLYEKYFVK